ncbi:hypothetical protein SPARM206S_00432 [Streptomyces parvulus]
MLLNKAVSNAFTVAFNSDEGTLFGVIRKDMKMRRTRRTRCPS